MIYALIRLPGTPASLRRVFDEDNGATYASRYPSIINEASEERLI